MKRVTKTKVRRGIGSAESRKFYNSLAPVYEQKVGWENRHLKETTLFNHIFEGGGVRAVCDIGCGDGGHAGEIVNRGASYLGIDNSAEMISIAKAKCGDNKGMEFLQADMLKLPRRLAEKFDLVLLLGNTLPHLLNRGELTKLFTGVSSILKPAGKFAVQTVNPGLLKKKSIHFLSPKLSDEGVLFHPIYVRAGELWEFHMLIDRISESRLQSSEIITTRLRFWDMKEIKQVAQRCKLRTTGVYGGAQLQKYHEMKSENLLLTFRKVEHA